MIVKKEERAKNEKLEKLEKSGYRWEIEYTIIQRERQEWCSSTWLAHGMREEGNGWWLFGPAFPWNRGDEGRGGERKRNGRPASWRTRTCDLGKSRI